MSEAAAPTLAALTERHRTMARIGHLVRRKQVEIERAVRLLRAHFIDRRPRAPKCGTLHRIMLVGPFAQPGSKPDRETGEINAYDLWAFVDHPEYRGRNRHWGLARRVVASSLRGRATVVLSVFTLDEIDRLRAAGNRFLTDQYDDGVVLYDRADAGSEEARK
ncbi:hypothetical protein [Sphingomonas abietis]|uniref:Uncharacterized protein n=1 Tax=Sphingomonas abietis TaxID=3012344 RepID=A0ABY7NS26_9SPHN|nr:hypothetical protein [Sphingomonas abietis]WBO24356.1 hypothetical protein PBT88_09760 [Sphingomonas abietis]